MQSVFNRSGLVDIASHRTDGELNPMPCDHATEKLRYDAPTDQVICECGASFPSVEALHRENCQLVQAVVRSIGRRRGGIQDWQKQGAQAPMER